MISLATVLSYFTWSAASSLLGSVWKGLCDFIATPVGAAVIAGLVMWGVGDIQGHRAADKTWQVKWYTAEATAEKARVQRDTDIKAKVEADANSRLAALAARKTQLEQQVQAYEDDEAKQAAVGNSKPPCACTTDSSDARWLRNAERGAVKPKAQRGFALRLRTLSR